MHLAFPAWVVTVIAALSLSPPQTATPTAKPVAATARQVFQKPTDGAVTKDFAAHAGEASQGVDLQSAPPAVSSSLCRAEAGSVDRNGAPLATGDHDQDGVCDDFEGAPVYAATAGFVYFAEVAQPKKSDPTPSYPHIVRIRHGTINGAAVETEYWHVGTKVRDAQRDWFGNAVTSFIMPWLQSQTWPKSAKGMCVNAGEQIASQGYSGRTTGTHLHYVLKEGSQQIDPEPWFTNRPADIVPPSQCPVLAVATAGGGGGKVTNVAGTTLTPYAPIDCGNGTSDCSETYRSGTLVVLEAVYDPTASYLGGWSGCDSVSGDTCTVTINASRSVTATVLPNPVCATISGSAYIETPLNPSNPRQTQTWTVTADQPVTTGTLSATDGGAVATVLYEVRIDGAGGVCRAVATSTLTATGGARARENSANSFMGRLFLDSLKSREHLVSADCSAEVLDTQACSGCDRPPSVTGTTRCIAMGSNGDSPYPAQSNWAEVNVGSTLSTDTRPPGLDFFYGEWSTTNSGTGQVRATFTY